MHDQISEYLRQEVLRRYEESGLSQRRFERSLGLREWSLKGILDKTAPRTPSVDIAQEIALALGLDFYVGPHRNPVVVDPSDFAPIPVHAATLAAGAGSENHTEDVIDHLAFRRDWLRSIGVSPTSSVIARAWGDSMSPTIKPGDVMLIDRARADPPSKVRAPGDARPATIYAILDDGHARVKRLELAAPGTLAVFSDNPEHPPEIRAVDAVNIIGRVAWWGHTNRE